MEESRKKFLQQNRAGIKTIILPEENKRDLDEIPENVKKKLKFVLVSSMEQVLEEALVRNEES